jgi:hypothetical protein
MTAEIRRIGRWTTISALEAAREELKDEDTLLIVAITKEDQMMKYWSANATNMQVNWMVDNVKSDIMFGSL